MQLRNARIVQGFSKNEVATILHVTRQSISKWENESGTNESGTDVHVLPHTPKHENDDH
ncbi:helix-turn-helix domain-containing protein [Levilactobacillus suantsaiihabitans]|uniref:helix-turn-helix domain-containing protein n=1 Tax=Levilactobacillus suantsaiihabitans TaxID=2487722 RepID=UPI00384B1FCD